MRNYNTQQIYAKWRKKKQQGFSTLEVLIATILIGTLIAGGIYYANIGQKVSIVELVSAKTAAVVRFPEAIATVYTLKQTLVGATADELTATGSVQSNEPVTWVISSETAATQNSIAIVFTFNNETDAASLQTYLSDNIDTTLIKEVTVGEGEDNNQVTVEYEIA